MNSVKVAAKRGVGALIQPHISVMHFPSSKHTQKKKQHFLRPDFCHESGGGARHKSNYIYPKKLLLLCRCQHLIHHALKTFPNPLLPYYSKIHEKRKISLTSPATLDFPHPSSQNITSTGVLLFLESVHSDSIKRRARISRITSKMAYHNEWAAGPPPPLASQTPKSSLVGNRHRCCCFSFWLAATERSNPSLHQASRGLFENADCIAAPSAYAIR